MEKPEGNLSVSVSEWKNELNANVGKREYNYEFDTAIELLQQSYRRKNWKNVCVLPDLLCFFGWKHRHRNNCVQDENHEKTHLLFHCEHGHVRSVSSDYHDP